MSKTSPRSSRAPKAKAPARKPAARKATSARKPVARKPAKATAVRKPATARAKPKATPRAAATPAVRKAPVRRPRPQPVAVEETFVHVPNVPPPTFWMKKKTWAFLGPILAIVFIAPLVLVAIYGTEDSSPGFRGSPQQRAETAEGRRITEAGFTVVFPNVPEREQHEMTFDGLEFPITVLAAENDDATLAVAMSYTQPSEVLGLTDAEIDEVLRMMAEGGASAIGGQLSQMTPSIVNGDRVLDFLVTVPDNSLYMRARAIYHNGSLYSLEGVSESPDLTGWPEFLASFRFVGDA